MARPKTKYAAFVGKIPNLSEIKRDEVLDSVKLSIREGAPIDDRVDVDESLTMISDIVEALLKSLTFKTAGRAWASEFARVYAEVRKLEAAFKTHTSNINLLVEAYEQVMVEQFEVEGIGSLKLANGQPITTFPEPHAVVVDKETFRIWCLEQGLGRLLALPWATTNKLLKDRLVAGDPEPDGVKAYMKTVVRLGSE